MKRQATTVTDVTCKKSVIDSGNSGALFHKSALLIGWIYQDKKEKRKIENVVTHVAPIRVSCILDCGL